MNCTFLVLKRKKLREYKLTFFYSKPVKKIKLKGKVAGSSISSIVQQQKRLRRRRQTTVVL